MVQSTILEQQFTGDGFGRGKIGCDVIGKVRNNGTRNQNVTLSFNAFGRGTLIATASTGQFFVPAGGESNFRAALIFVVDCDDVKRLEIKEIKAEPA